MIKKISKRRREMGEEAWAIYQQDRIRQKSQRQTERDRNTKKSMRWRRDAKRKLIEYKGGCCQVCGYNKDCPGVYHFHHRDPHTKDFGISSKGKIKSWETLKAEADKCDLLCANCHAEIHDLEFCKDRFEQLSEWDSQEHYRNRKKYKTVQKTCVHCLGVYETTNEKRQFCSVDCFNYSRYKVHDRPSKNELATMLKTMSWRAIGRKFNVSDNAVRKWAKKYGLIAP